ncbi:MAG: helix-turn-helix transcriptional regulator [Acidimicrobiia bacterium]
MTSRRTALRLRRLLSVVPYVLAHPGVGVGDLSSRFGYSSDREVLQDLELILVCGLPGYYPGDLIGAWIDNDEVVIETADYFERAPRLTPAEALMLVAGGHAVLSAGVDVPELASGVAKLERALIGDEALVTVDLGSDPAAVTELRRAVAGNLVVEIVYTSLSKGETKTRRVEPWAVLSTMGNWYLTGWCRLVDAERAFRLDRIRQFEVLDERFQPPAGQPEPTIRYTPGDGDTEAVIDLAPAATWIAEYYPVEQLGMQADGSTRVRFSAADPRVAARLLLRLGTAARLVDGEEVAAAAADLRSRIRRRYRRASQRTTRE